MTHVAEERNIAAPPGVIWDIISDSRRWPEFYHTHDKRGILDSVTFVHGNEDAVGAVRRMDFRLGFTWDERCVTFEPPTRLKWDGVRTPALRSLVTEMELVPGDGFTTLRWDVFFQADAPRIVKPLVAGKVRRVLEDVALTGLLEVDRLAMTALARRDRGSP